MENQMGIYYENCTLVLKGLRKYSEIITKKFSWSTFGKEKIQKKMLYLHVS